mmetsp:Transcript_78209/g.253264  ORF Transcript_78209/g.253264 Transcript_78209/m.253264 type:complete len:391 (+) Transcript_78209:52-1224(+)
MQAPSWQKAWGSQLGQLVPALLGLPQRQLRHGVALQLKRRRSAKHTDHEEAVPGALRPWEDRVRLVAREAEGERSGLFAASAGSLRSPTAALPLQQRRLLCARQRHGVRLDGVFPLQGPLRARRPGPHFGHPGAAVGQLPQDVPLWRHHRDAAGCHCCKRLAGRHPNQRAGLLLVRRRPPQLRFAGTAHVEPGVKAALGKLRVLHIRRDETAPEVEGLHAGCSVALLAERTELRRVCVHAAAPLDMLLAGQLQVRLENADATFLERFAHSSATQCRVQVRALRAEQHGRRLHVFGLHHAPWEDHRVGHEGGPRRSLDTAHAVVELGVSHSGVAELAIGDTLVRGQNDNRSRQPPRFAATRAAGCAGRRPHCAPQLRQRSHRGQYRPQRHC